MGPSSGSQLATPPASTAPHPRAARVVDRNRNLVGSTAPAAGIVDHNRERQHRTTVQRVVDRNSQLGRQHRTLRAALVDHNRERQHNVLRASSIAIASGSTALPWSIAIVSGSTLYCVRR
jgi:hypothetical protein